MTGQQYDHTHYDYKENQPQIILIHRVSKEKNDVNKLDLYFLANGINENVGRMLDNVNDADGEQETYE